MEFRDSVNQQRGAVTRFISEHRALLSRHGSLMATWRNRGGVRMGPYFVLSVRDEHGRRRSVYLGAEGPLVDEVQAELARLRAPEFQRQASRQAQRELRRALRKAKRELDQQLAPRGLWRKGCEVRGWRGGRKPP